MPAVIGFSSTASKKRKAPVTAPETALDRLVGQIERGSQDPFGYNRQSYKSRFDMEILAGYVDPDELANEERICATHARPFLHIDDFGEEAADGLAAVNPPSEQFLGGDSCQCDHDAGNVCITCVTQIDLMAIPASLRKSVTSHVDHVHGRLMELFDVVVPRRVAEELHLVPSFD